MCIPTVLASCAVLYLCSYLQFLCGVLWFVVCILSVKFWQALLCIYICVYLHSFSVACCWFKYMFNATVSVWCVVGVCLSLFLQFQHVMLQVYIYVSLQFQHGVLLGYVLFCSFSVVCCWFIFMFISTVSAWRAVGFQGFHSRSKVVALLDMQVHVLSALQDNYMYLVS